MSSMKKNVSPSLYNMAYKIALKTYSALLCQLVFMGPKLTSVLKQTSSFNSLDISKQAACQIYTDRSLIDQRKVQSLVSNGTLNSNLKQKSYGRNGFEMESVKMRVIIIHAKRGNILGTFYLERFHKPRAENGYKVEPFEVVVTLEDLFLRVFEIAYAKSSILTAFFQQLPQKTNVSVKTDRPKTCSVPTYMNPTILNLFYRQLLTETRKFTLDLLDKLVLVIMKLQNPNPIFWQLPSEMNDFEKNSVDFGKPTEKPVLTATQNYAESQTSDPPSDFISMKSVQTCDECREHIKTKKFFDERRFGILEKCMCVICYGCIRKISGTSNGVVKGPVRCPRCFVKSDNVASSACWIQGQEKVEFFKKYCENVQNTNIKLRLGWSSFPIRKDDTWTRVP